MKAGRGADATCDADPSGSAGEVLAAFLKLGLRSFGGPVAHLGYFRDEFVTRRKWLDERAFADLVALCQFLPGPASSQVGFAIGLRRAGYVGGIAAWTGFTLPSAIALAAFALGSQAFQGRLGMGVLHGLQLVAIAVVAQAVLGMARNLCPDRTRATIATVAALIALLAPTAAGQIATILFGAIAGFMLCRNGTSAGVENAVPITTCVSRRAGLGALSLFLLLLVGLPVAAMLDRGQSLPLFAAFYRSGALVFGGGHVVLPLLRDAIVAPGFVDSQTFLAGYGAAQAVPGPLFTFAAFLGAKAASPWGGPGGAAIGLFAIFLPGLLILLAALPFWESLRRKAGARTILRGVNAAVVGLLGAALYDPIFTGAVKTHGDFSVALLGFVLLAIWRMPPVGVVLFGAAAGALLAIMQF